MEINLHLTLLPSLDLFIKADELTTTILWQNLTFYQGNYKISAPRVS